MEIEPLEYMDTITAYSYNEPGFQEVHWNGRKISVNKPMMGRAGVRFEGDIQVDKDQKISGGGKIVIDFPPPAPPQPAPRSEFSNSEPREKPQPKSAPKQPEPNQ